MIFFLIQSIEDPEDRDKLIRLYINHYALMKSKAFTILRNSDTAEDIVQDAMVRVIKKIEELRNFTDAQLLGYVVRIIKNCAIDYLKKSSHERDAILEAKYLSDDSSENFFEEIMHSLDSEDLSVQLGIALRELSFRDRSVLIYKYVLEYEDTKIAELLGIQANSVRMILTRARRRISAGFRQTTEVGRLEHEE